jgi:hypothetical protein
VVLSRLGPDLVLARLGAESAAARRRIAELDRAVTRAQAKIRTETARRAAALQLAQLRIAEASFTAANAGWAPAAQQAGTQPAGRITAASPAVHTTTGASGSVTGSESDGPSDGKPGTGSAAGND